ncbi:hypothetical protein [Aestuariispira insulae]|uniref:Uncharacterized protein n=1 Tax=Aestuariispira insulae TaxID=1461337 RepID=A0A3D9HK46_9PROT|nr:hypothetical protein [Aestuariispira insulae]RED49834.1 hypothetical protein DFP90_105206 [Aestuariispira insulae]
MDQKSLPEIPLIELGDGLWDLTDPALRSRAYDLLVEGRRLVGKTRLRMLDRFSRAWAERTDNPHCADIRRMALDLPLGLWFMNFCYEWGCTTRVSTHPETGQPSLMRTLDWPFVGIGRNLVIGHHSDQAGFDFYNLAWPGYTGVITGMAPGRFAIAINQAPMRKPTPVLVLNWLLARPRIWNTKALPPAHLLRQVFDQCPDYNAAVIMLSETPLALPVIFSVAGVRPGETCIIERLENDHQHLAGDNATGNHWQRYDLPAIPRGEDSHERRDQLAREEWQRMAEFHWVRPPVLNPFTRLAVETCPANGHLRVQGYEQDGPATSEFLLSQKM